MNNLLQALSNLINENILLAPVFCLIAGAITSFMPCSLSTLPLVLGYVGANNAKDAKHSFKLSLMFALGMTITGTVLGVTASLFGRLMWFARKLVVYITWCNNDTYGTTSKRSFSFDKAYIFN